jgi:hypothetical protein
MNQPRPTRGVVLTGAVCLLIVGGCGLSWQSHQRQEALNRQLIAALVTNDIVQATALATAGANPKTHYTPPPESAFQRFWDYVRHRSSPPAKAGPTAFEMACGSRWDASYKDSVNWPKRPEWPQLVEVMLQHGANLNVPDKDGLTPLHWAAVTGRPETIRVLVDHGAAINKVSTVCDMTPLQLACIKSPESVRLLLDHGANVNEQTQDGFRTALQCAVVVASGAPTLDDYKKDTKVIQQLLAHGANPDTHNAKGRTAIETAQLEGCPELVPLLKQAGVKK